MAHGAAKALEPGSSGEGDACLNCGADLGGSYCSACGQKHTSLEISLRSLVSDTLAGLFSFDSRLLRTLKPLIVRPAFLTTEFWSGRRVRYVPPLRLYLFISFVMFLGLSLTGDADFTFSTSGSQASSLGGAVTVTTGDGSIDEVDWEELADGGGFLWRWFTLSVIRPIMADPDGAAKAFFDRLPWAVFLLVPAVGAYLQVLFRGSNRYYVPHLIFSLHLHAALFLFHTFGRMLDLATGSERPGSVLGLVMVLYQFLALKRAYTRGWLATAWRQVALLVAQLVSLILLLVLSIVLAGISL